MRKSGVQLTLFYFLVVALMGVLMRSMALFSVPGFAYSNVLHAHSHVAILGWAYMALFLLIYKLFIPQQRIGSSSKQLQVLYGLTQLAVVGMLVSFILQGYALFSIAFSTMHIVLSYWFVSDVWRKLREPQLSVTILKGSLLCLVVSSIGPWMLAILSANALTGSSWYDAAIYFYLHFQYNGWLALGLIAVFLRLLERKAVAYPDRLAKWQWWLYAGSLLPTFLQAMLWLDIGPFLTVIAALATITNWLSITLLCVIGYRLREPLSRLFHGWASRFFVLACMALFLKSAMSLGTLVPDLADMIYTTRPVIIGYLHLILLGFISFALLALYLQQGWLSGNIGITRLGFALLVFGFIMNELILFLQGLWEWLRIEPFSYAYEGLWLTSLVMALGILLFQTAISKKSKDDVML